MCVCVLTVPSEPTELSYMNSTENTMTLSWKQSGVVDKYVVEVNNTETVNFTIVSSDNGSVSLTVGDLLTSGDYYCISVTAVSGLLRNVGAILCNHTGEMWQRKCLCRRCNHQTS